MSSMKELHKFNKNIFFFNLGNTNPETNNKPLANFPVPIFKAKHCVSPTF